MNATILLVDDNVTNLKLAADVLMLDGHAIVKALDANEALSLLETFRPDLILMDLAMPGMDGLALTRLLKAEARFRDVPIVALTASAMKGDDHKALAAGCDGYITKPIDTRTFGSTVATFLRPDRGEP